MMMVERAIMMLARGGGVVGVFGNNLITEREREDVVRKRFG